MTLPVMEPRRQVTAAVRHPLVWRSRDLSLNAVSGQTGTLVRATTGAADDSFGTSRTCVHSQPRWHVRSSLVTMRMGGAGGTPVEYLRWSVPFDAVAASIYLDFIENGTIGIATGGLFSLSSTAFATPRWYMSVVSGKYSIIQHNGTTDTGGTAFAAAPVNGDRVRMRCWLYSNGSVQAWQSINGAAETATAQSGSLALASWSTPTHLQINALGTGNIGSNDFIAVVLARGNLTQAQLMAAAS